MAQASSSLKSRDMCTFTYATLTLTTEAVHLVTYAKLFYKKSNRLYNPSLLILGQHLLIPNT